LGHKSSGVDDAEALKPRIALLLAGIRLAFEEDQRDRACALPFGRMPVMIRELADQQRVSRCKMHGSSGCLRVAEVANVALVRRKMSCQGVTTLPDLCGLLEIRMAARRGPSGALTGASGLMPASNGISFAPAVAVAA
jgi:hypothetical protein